MRSNAGVKKMVAGMLVLIMSIMVMPTASARTIKDSGQRRTGDRDRSGKEVYTGTVVFIGGRLSGRSTTFTLTIDGNTSDEEMTRDVDLLRAKGQDELLDAIRKERKGTFQIGSELGQDLNIVQIGEGEEGGKKITAVFTRWMRFAEVRAGSRTTDYPFSYVELVIDSRGKGNGTFIPLARLDFDKKKNALEIENFGAFPAKLMGVRKRG
ncbi:MAG: hypothetical protein ABI882_05455 [Acidobacteriota bacterium]